MAGVRILGLGQHAVQVVSSGSGYQHGDANDENPDQQLDLHHGISDAQKNESDQGHARYPVGLETVGAWPHGIPSIVSGAVGNHARVACVIFLDLKDNLHQIGADIGDFGEDAAGNAERRCAQRFANSKANKARPSIRSGDEEQDDQHHQKLNADQHHADAHARLKWNLINREGFSTKAGEGSARIGKGVDADAEPGDAIASTDPKDAEGQNNAYPNGLKVQKHAEIHDDDHRNEYPKQEQKLALGDEISLAGFPDQLGHFLHGLVNRQALESAVNDQAEDESEDAKQNAEHQQPVAIETQELNLGEIREL